MQPRTVTKGKERVCSAEGIRGRRSITNFRCDEICHNILFAQASNNFMKVNKAVVSIGTGQNVFPCPAINNILTVAIDNDVIAFPAVDGVTSGAAVNRVITGKLLDQFGCCYSTVTEWFGRVFKINRSKLI